MTRSACRKVPRVCRIRSARECCGRVGDVGAPERFGDEFLREPIFGAQGHEAIEVAKRHARFINRTQTGGQVGDGLHGASGSKPRFSAFVEDFDKRAINRV